MKKKAFERLLTQLSFISIAEELQTLRESETRLKQQYAESQRRERILVRRLAVKEQEIQDYAVNISFSLYKMPNHFFFFILISP